MLGHRQGPAGARRRGKHSGRGARKTPPVLTWPQRGRPQPLGRWSTAQQCAARAPLPSPAGRARARWRGGAGSAIARVVGWGGGWGCPALPAGGACAAGGWGRHRPSQEAAPSWQPQSTREHAQRCRCQHGRCDQQQPGRLRGLACRAGACAAAAAGAALAAAAAPAGRLRDVWPGRLRRPATLACGCGADGGRHTLERWRAAVVVGAPAACQLPAPGQHTPSACRPPGKAWLECAGRCGAGMALEGWH